MIGDRLNDIEFARRAGLIPILVRSGLGRESEAAASVEKRECVVFDNLAAAANAIIRNFLA